MRSRAGAAATTSTATMASSTSKKGQSLYRLKVAIASLSETETAKRLKRSDDARTPLELRFCTSYSHRLRQGQTGGKYQTTIEGCRVSSLRPESVRYSIKFLGSKRFAAGTKSSVEPLCPLRDGGEHLRARGGRDLDVRTCSCR